MKIAMKFPYADGWGYSNEYRESVIRDCLNATRVADIAAERRVSASSIYRWWRDVELVKE